MTFVARFREVVKENASRVAIEDGAIRMTYAELDARAREFAFDVKAGDVVPLHMDKSASLVCGMLGAWYANAAFMVLTSDLPRERAERMERDARACKDAAYVVFTSGTTGTPKGVIVEHDGIVPMLDAQIAAFDIFPGARCLWMLSPLFDASISDVGTALLAGATLVVHHDRLAPRAFWQRVDELAISHIDMPPALLPLLDAGRIPKTLKTIVIGGEACAPDAIRRFASRVRLVNVYGPTEATVCTSMNVCTADEHGARIGRPLEHVVYRVEDDELLIGGACLARGYANDEELTARRFVMRDGERFYRTGDRVRARPDGELEIIGRLDRQVKVAGVRIEPEEIEACLREDASIAEAAVIPVDRKLRAFVVGRDALDLDAVRRRLETRLPQRLMPASFIALDELPRGATGKVDHAALAKLPREASSGVLPINEIERVLCSSMGHALKRTIASDDDFIALGGDSLAVLEVCAAVDAQGVIVSPESIVTERTPARIARCGELGGMTTEALMLDLASILRTAIRAAEARAPRAIFLTGATGTLGSHLLAELSRLGLAVTCLVRAANDDEAVARLPTKSRVRAIAGDITLERFGLARSRWESLAAEHDAIVHCAADLSLTSPYASLRAANVVGTMRALELASAGAAKTFHHVSTLSVLACTDLARTGRAFRERDSLHSAHVIHGGYAQSKWSAEALVRETAPSAFVHRLGLLLPSRRRDLFGAFVRGLATVECFPADVADELRFDVTPVDFAARALASFVHAPRGSRTRHIANHVAASLGDLARAMQSEGVKLEGVSSNSFRETVAARRAKISGLALASFRAMNGAALHAFDLFEATNVTFDTDATLEELAQAGIECASPAGMLGEYVRAALSGEPR